MAHFRDLTGLKQNRLTVISIVYDDKSYISYTCLCDCGNTTVVRGSHIIGNRIKSCGCLRNEAASKRWRKYVTKEDSANNYHYITYQNAAKKRNLIFDLTLNEFIAITSQACYYCGILPQARYINRDYIHYYANGVDRLDSKQAYTKDNCVSACTDCNLAKQSLTVEQFLTLCKRVTQNWL